MTIEEKKSNNETDDRQECIDRLPENNDEREKRLNFVVDRLSLIGSP